MKPINFLFAVHADLPAGEGEARLEATAWVLNQLITLLKAYPQVRMGLAISGSVGDWLEFEDLELMETLSQLVARRQVEMLAVTHGAAVAHAIPSRDAVLQIQRNLEWNRRVLDARPRGFWCTGRAWDGGLPRLLSRCNMQYTFVDDRLMAAAGDSSRNRGWYVAEREGTGIGVVPLDTRLRRFVPWGEPLGLAQELHSRAQAGNRCMAVGVSTAMLGEDPAVRGRLWDPRRGWFVRVFKMITGQSSWLKMPVPKDLLKQFRPAGRVTIVSGTSLREGVASLPIVKAKRLRRLRGTLERGDDPILVDAEPWIVGPPWESCFARYPEANHLHKRMLAVSLSLAQAARRHAKDSDKLAQVDQLREVLHIAQSGELFADTATGGALRGDLRHTGWDALIQVESGLRDLAGKSDSIDLLNRDVDCDGQTEIQVLTPTFGAVVIPARGGALTELSIWGVGNVLNTWSRREAYWHEDLARSSAMPVLVEPKDEDHQGDVEIEDDDDEPVESTEELSRPPENIGEIPLPPRLQVMAAEPGLDRLLVPERCTRASMQEHFFGDPLTLENLSRGQYPEAGDFLEAAYQIQAAETPSINEQRITLAREGTVLQGAERRLVRVYKQYRFYEGIPEIDVEVTVANRYHEPIRATFGIEINLNLDSQQGDARFLAIPGRERVFLNQSAVLDNVEEAVMVFEDRQLQVSLSTQDPAQLYTFPVMTPSRGPVGYQASFQGTCLILAWALELWGEEKRTFQLRWTVTKA